MTRAIAIASGIPYIEVYDGISTMALREPPGDRKRSSARNGVHKATLYRYMAALGWKWHPTMGIGTGCRVHMREDELPMGCLVVNLSRHVTAVIDKVVYDLGDPTRDGTRCVYGYWSKP